MMIETEKQRMTHFAYFTVTGFHVTVITERFPLILQ